MDGMSRQGKNGGRNSHFGLYGIETPSVYFALVGRKESL
jgi:hypothetical protein